MSKGLPSGTTDFADHCIDLHKRVQTLDLSGLSEDDKESVTWCRSVIDERIEFYGGEAEVYWEYKVPISDGDEVLSEGTLDCALVIPDMVEIYDFKFGHIPVQKAESNIQVAGYAVGGMQEWDKESATINILQPWVSPRMTKAYFTEQEPVISLIKEIIAKSEEPALLLNPSEEACKYCPAKECCPAIRMQLETTARTSVDMLKDLPAEKVGQVLDIAKLAKDWAGQVEKEAKRIALELLGQGEKIPGYGIMKKNGRRTLSCPWDAETALSEYLPVGTVAEICTVKVTEIEQAFIKAYKEKHPGETNLQAKVVFDESLGDLIEYGKESFSLVAD